MQIIEYCGSILTAEFPLRVEQNFTSRRNQRQKMEYNVTISLSYLVYMELPRGSSTNGPCTIFLEDLSDGNMLEHFNIMTSHVINPNPLDWQGFLLVVMAMTWHCIEFKSLSIYYSTWDGSAQHGQDQSCVHFNKIKTKERKDQSCIVLLNTCILFDLHVHSLS